MVEAAALVVIGGWGRGGVVVFLLLLWPLIEICRCRCYLPEHSSSHVRVVQRVQPDNSKKWPSPSNLRQVFFSVTTVAGSPSIEPIKIPRVSSTP